MSTTHARIDHVLTKVPEVTAAFWLTKVLTTGMGEAALVAHLSLRRRPAGSPTDRLALQFD